MLGASMIECARCHRPLTAPVYSDSGAAYGSTCAERVGLLRAPTPRDATRTALRVPRGGEDERQCELFGAAEGFPYATTPFADWPWVAAHRARTAGDARATADCDGCQLFGLCARCAGHATRTHRGVAEERERALRGGQG